VDTEEEEASGSITNLYINLELLIEAVDDVDLRVNAIPKHQGLDSTFWGTSFMTLESGLARILVCSLTQMNLPGMLFQPCMEIKPHLKSGLAAGVYRLLSQGIRVSLDALATTLDIDI
jgi:hypothetical protein